jgi:Phosphatidylglycerophosphate synthase
VRVHEARNGKRRHRTILSGSDDAHRQRFARSTAERADAGAAGADPGVHRLLLAADGGYSWPAAIVFAIAGITDQVDGFLARRWHVESGFGKIADPLPTG